MKPLAYLRAVAQKPDSLFLILAAIIAAISTLLQIGALGCGEVIDDHLLLHSVLDRGCDTNPIACFSHPVFGLYYRPILGASFALGVRLHSGAVALFHLENLLLHAAGVGLAIWMFRLILQRRRTALLAGALFASHPVQVGMTTFIGGRTDSLCLLFLLFAVAAVAKQAQVEAAGVRIGWRVLSILAFAAAIFTKEQCAGLVLLLPLVQRCAQRTGRDRPLRCSWMLLFALPVTGYLAAAFKVIPHQAIDRAPWGPSLRIEIVARTIWYYTKLIFFPVVRTLHQSSTGPWYPPQLGVVLLGSCAAGVGLAVLLSSWRQPEKRLFALWALVAIAPCLNVFPLPSQYLAEYRMALSLPGLAGLAALAMETYLAPLAKWLCASDKTPITRLWVAAAPLALLLLLSIGTWADVGVWRSDITFQGEQYAADPNFIPALGGLAQHLYEQRRYRESLADYNLVMAATFPNSGTEQERIAFLSAPDAREHIQSISSLRYQTGPFVLTVARGRGAVEQMLGRYEDAASDFRLAIAAAPSDPLSIVALAQCDIAMGHALAAEGLLRGLVAVAPAAINYVWLGWVFAQEYDWQDAKLAYAQSLAVAARTKDNGAFDAVRARAMYQDAVNRLPHDSGMSPP